MIFPAYKPLTAYKPTAAARARRQRTGHPLLLTEIHVHPNGRAVGLYGQHPPIPYGTFLELLESHDLTVADVRLVP